MVNATPEPLVPLSFTGSTYSTNVLYDWSCGQIGDLNWLSDPLTVNCKLAATFSSFKSCHHFSLNQRVAYSCFALIRHLHSSESDLLTLMYLFCLYYDAFFLCLLTPSLLNVQQFLATFLAWVCLLTTLHLLSCLLCPSAHPPVSKHHYFLFQYAQPSELFVVDCCLNLLLHCSAFAFLPG